MLYHFHVYRGRRLVTSFFVFPFSCLYSHCLNMKLDLFHILAYVVVGVVLAAEKEKPPVYTPFEKVLLWIDDRMTGIINPTALAKPGDECLVASVRRSLLRVSLIDLKILDWSYPRSISCAPNVQWRSPDSRVVLRRTPCIWEQFQCRRKRSGYRCRIL